MMHQSSARLVGPILGARALWQVSLARTRAHISDHPTEPRGADHEWAETRQRLNISERVALGNQSAASRGR